MPTKEADPVELALAYAVVALRASNPDMTDIEITHILLNKGHGGKEIPHGLLEAIAKEAGKIKPPTYSLKAYLEELGPSVPGASQSGGGERHEGMKDALTGDGISRQRQEAGELYVDPDYLD